ncbi:MAG: hypothetical protein RIS35_2789 [Pseudomonadota bacterium]|jgi:uncharacterized membrane protein YfcA
MSLEIALLLLGMGAVIGFLAGLLGIGGGMLMVPFVTLVLSSTGFPPEHTVRVAIATSLTTILFTSISSVRAHHRRGAVLWPVVRSLAPGIVVGSLAGAQVAGLLRGPWLAGFFAAFVSMTATQMLLSKPVTAGTEARGLPGAPSMFGVGGLIGIISALVGAGGGFLTVPFLSSRGVQIQKAVACSAACGFPIALAGSIGYVAAGWGAGLPGPMLGYVYLPALVFIVISSVLTAPLGARAAHAMPTAQLKKVFAFLLYGVAAYMFWKAINP